MTVVLSAPAEQPSLVERLAAPGTRVVVFGASRDHNAKVTLLVTPAGATRPLLAVKTATTAVAAEAVVAEAQVLAAVHRLPLGVLRPTIPQVRQLTQSGGFPAMVCDVLPGQPMSLDYHRFGHTADPRRVADDLQLMTGWLAALQTATAGPAAPVSWPAELRTRLLRRHAGAPSLPAVAAALASASHRLAPFTTPRTAVHGDLWVGNVLRESGRLSGVVDWEAGAVAGEPLRDLARCVVSYALYLDRHTRPGRRVRGHQGLRAKRWGSGVSYVLNGDGWFPDLTRALLQDGLRRLGLPPAAWRDIVLTGLAEVAASADEPEFARHHLDLIADEASSCTPAPRSSR